MTPPRVLTAQLQTNNVIGTVITSVPLSLLYIFDHVRHILLLRQYRSNYYGVKTMSKLKTYAVSLGAALLTGGLGAIVTYSGMDSYKQITQPPLSPPSWLFPIVWSILFILMGISAARVFLEGGEKSSAALTVYGCQLAANFLWCVFFFGLGIYYLSFFWLLLLLALVIATAVLFFRIDRPAGIMMIPYILWLCFAAYLNLAIAIIN